METEICFKGFEANQSLLEYVTSKTTLVAQSFLEDRDFRLDVRLTADRPRTNRRKPHFICEVILHIAGRRRPVIVKKSSDDFYQAIHKANHSLKTILRRTSDKEAHHGRNHHLEPTAA
jgi:ribosome-associated translation inhibitor RaiA